MTCTCDDAGIGGFCRLHPSKDPVGDLRAYLRGVAPTAHGMLGGGEDLLLAVVRHLEAGHRRCAFFTTGATCCHPENPDKGSVAAAALEAS